MKDDYSKASPWKVEGAHVTTEQIPIGIRIGGLPPEEDAPKTRLRGWNERYSVPQDSIDAVTAYITTLEAERDAAYAKGIEDAARVAESKMQRDIEGNLAWWYSDGNGACRSIATAIRALQDKPAG